jgi:hypothetical protein
MAVGNAGVFISTRTCRGGVRRINRRVCVCARSFPFVRSELPSVLCTRLWLVTLTTTTPPPCRQTHTLSMFSRDEREILPPRRQLFVAVFSIFQRDGQRERGQSTGVTGAFGLSQCRCLPDRGTLASVMSHTHTHTRTRRRQVCTMCGLGTEMCKREVAWGACVAG